MRFYEDKGLLSPARDGLNRIYSYQDRGRLILILRGKRLGFSLSTIRDILDLYAGGDGGPAQLLASQKKFEAQIVALERQKVDLDNAIEELRASVSFFSQRLSALQLGGLEAAGAEHMAVQAGAK